MRRTARLSLFLFGFLGLFGCYLFRVENSLGFESIPQTVFFITESRPPNLTPEIENPERDFKPGLLDRPFGGAHVLATESPLTSTSEIQLEIFEELWRIVNQEYLYQDFNGVDWKAVGESYRAHIESGISNESFYLLMDEMIRLLDDDHSVYLSPDDAEEEDDELEGNLEYVGIGILSGAIPERNRIVVYLTFPGSPAEKAGIKSRDSILYIDGQEALKSTGEINEVLRGLEGTEVNLTVQSPGELPREVVLPRKRIEGAIPVPHWVYTTDTDRKVGYLLLATLFDKTVPGKVEAALKDMMQENNLDGLIIDNRLNSGGVDYILADVLEYFTQGTLGYFVNRDKRFPFRVSGVDIGGSQKIPLVVLIGEETISFGEVFAGVLRDQQRAYLIGETTLGNVETLWGYDFKDGSRAWIAHDTFRPLNDHDADWEQYGIVPDLILRGSWDEHSFETDPVIKAAIRYFEQ